MNREETVIQKFGRNFSKDTILFRDGDLSRIIHILTQMAETSGTKGGEDVVINVSPQELAQEVSIDVSVANDLLKRLCEINLIEIEGKTIRIKSIYKLRFFDLLAIKKASGQI